MAGSKNIFQSNAKTVVDRVNRNTGTTGSSSHRDGSFANKTINAEDYYMIHGGGSWTINNPSLPNIQKNPNIGTNKASDKILAPYANNYNDTIKQVLNQNTSQTLSNIDALSKVASITPKTMRVNTGGDILNARSGPGTTFSTSGSYRDGTQVTVTAKSGEWYKTSDGRWVNGNYLTSGQAAKSKPITQGSVGSGASYSSYNNNRQAQNRADVKKKTQEVKKIADTATSKALDEKFKEAMMHSTSVKRVADLRRSVHILGGPFQYLEHVDFRPNHENGLGRRFGETIMCEPPVVNFIPCVPTYLPELNKETKNHVSAALTNWLKGDGLDQYGKAGLESLFKDGSEVRYFTATPSYPRYIRIVNLMCRGLARFMGIEKMKGPDGKTELAGYDWATYKWEPKAFKTAVEKNPKKNKNVFEKAVDFSQEISKVLSYKDISVPFYVDSSTSISESYSNSTTQSQFAGMANGLEGLMKDYQFFTGALGASSLQNASISMADAANSVTSYARLNDGIFRRFLRGTSEILRGANMIFPDIWSDSTPSRSVSVTMNFTSPYGDPYSVYLHTLVPVMHVIPLFAPIQSSANSYGSPFLVKANSKGWFNVDMGMIDSVSIDKAPDGQWTMDGYPTTIKVSLGITDLYHNFMVTSTHSPVLFFKNDGIMEYLAVQGNIDLNRVHPEIILDVASRMLWENIAEFPKELGADVMMSWSNRFRSIFGIR
jgi:SH3 domain protein